ncbi:MAG: hypothetical protein JW720_08570 [Sedimentisphaerales bacterium]|nr:hypothetical protein [Sedimentisphaerales bacterium]
MAHNQSSARQDGKIESLSLAVVTPVNDEQCLAENLAASPMLQDGTIPLIVQRGYKSASEAYNDGLDAADADIVIFAHQDVYFPQGWEKKLLLAVETLRHRRVDWGVLGVIGSDKNRKLVGGAWSNGLQWKIESDKFESPAPVRTFDEIVLILRKGGGIRFDDNLPGFHLYGTDIALTAIQAGLGAYVFDAPVIHNSIWRKKLGLSYCSAYRYMQRKWWDELPVYTLILPLTRSVWPLLRNWCREKKKWLVRRFRPMPLRIRYPDPAGKAAEIGYDFTE